MIVVGAKFSTPSFASKQKTQPRFCPVTLSVSLYSLDKTGLGRISNFKQPTLVRNQRLAHFSPCQLKHQGFGHTLINHCQRIIVQFVDLKFKFSCSSSRVYPIFRRSHLSLVPFFKYFCPTQIFQKLAQHLVQYETSGSDSIRTTKCG